MNQRGQTLIEVLAALSAVVVVIAAVTVASLTSLQNAQFSRDQNLATQIAQQGLDIVRNMRDQNISNISSVNLPGDPQTTYCLAKTCTKLDSANASCWQKGISCGQNYDTFVREIVVSQNDTSCSNNTSGVQLVKITANVSWSDTKCTDATSPFCHRVSLSTCFSDFTVAPTP